VGEGALCFFLNSFAFLSSNAGFKSNLIIVNNLSHKSEKATKRSCHTDVTFIRTLWKQGATWCGLRQLARCYSYTRRSTSNTTSSSHTRSTFTALEFKHMHYKPPMYNLIFPWTLEMCLLQSKTKNICHTLAKDSMDSHGIRQGPAYQIPKFCTGLVNNMRN
jgi:hypothetical protein